MCDIVRTRFNSPGPTDKDRGLHNGFTIEVDRIGFTETHDKALIKGMDIDLAVSFLPKSSVALYLFEFDTDSLQKVLQRPPKV